MKIGSLETAMQIPRKPETAVEVRLQRALIREYTGMIAEVDTFMAGLNDKVPEGPQIRTEALALRDATRQLPRFTAGPLAGPADHPGAERRGECPSGGRGAGGAGQSGAAAGPQRPAPPPDRRDPGPHPGRGGRLAPLNPPDAP